MQSSVGDDLNVRFCMLLKGTVKVKKAPFYGLHFDEWSH